MRVLLRRLIILLVLAIIATLVYSNRDRIGLLNNNKIRIQGEWHRVEFDFKQPELYTFVERMIDKDGDDWGTYHFRKNTIIEVAAGSNVTTYEIEFPDDDNMIWYTRYKGELRPSMRWRR